jgi:4'-phosphopantetheinyl transferase
VARTTMQPNGLQLRADEVHVWCVDLDDPSDSSASLHALLDEEERSRSARFRYERDRQRFIVAHAVLRKLLARYIGTCPEQITYQHNEFGKPDLHSSWCSRLKFNLSHSAGLALIAVTGDAEVGVDLERIRMQSDLNEVVSSFFSPAEYEELMALPDERRSEAFFGCWTKKEAYFKASGCGLTIPLDSFSVAFTGVADTTPVDLIQPTDNGHTARRWAVHTLAPAAGYAGALVVGDNRRRLREWLWQPAGRSDVHAWRIPA